MTLTREQIEAPMPDELMTKERCEAGIAFALSFNGPVELDRPTYLALCKTALKAFEPRRLPAWIQSHFEEQVKWADGDGLAEVFVNTEAVRELIALQAPQFQPANSPDRGDAIAYTVIGMDLAQPVPPSDVVEKVE